MNTVDSSRTAGTASFIRRALAVAALTLPAAVFASPVSMTLTGVGSGAVMGGVYTSPYTASINGGGPTSIVCDDFLTEVGVGLHWTANVTNMTAFDGATGPLTSLKFNPDGTLATQKTDYMEIAWLSTQIMAIDQSTAAGRTKAGEYSFAIWSIFDPAALNNLSGSNLANAKQDLAMAASQIVNDTPDTFANVNIYTPNPLNASQEYITVSVPEPSSVGLIGLGLAGLVAARRRKPAAL